MPAPATVDAPILLAADEYEVALPATSLDFQSRVGRPSGNDGLPVPAVLVLTRAADAEVDELSLRLAAAGVPMVRVDSDRVRGESFTWDVTSGIVRFDGATFTPAVCWVRSFYRSSVARSASDTGVDRYVRDGWSQLVAALAAGPTSSVLNAGCDMARPDHLSQLAAARAAGFRVPVTVVTTDLAAGAAHIPGHGDVVVKALADHFVEHVPGRLAGAFPRRVTRHDLAGRPLEPTPVLLQEFVAARRELRVQAVGEQLFGFEVDKAAPHVLWTDPASVRVRPVEVPPAVARGLLRLVAHWQLDVAAFDVLESADGPVFLEVNPTGDWLSFEACTGSSPITDAVVDLVGQRFITHATPTQGSNR